MAKVMISVPDDLLARLDARAQANQETRSGLLQRLAEQELRRDEGRRRAEISLLLDQIRSLGPGDNAEVDAAQLVREDRESH